MGFVLLDLLLYSCERHVLRKLKRNGEGGWGGGGVHTMEDTMKSTIGYITWQVTMHVHLFLYSSHLEWSVSAT